MKVIEFPQSQDDKQSILNFLYEVRQAAEENNVTDAVIVMMNEDGELGVSIASSYIDAMGMLSLAIREI